MVGDDEDAAVPGTEVSRSTTATTTTSTTAASTPTRTLVPLVSPRRASRRRGLGTAAPTSPTAAGGRRRRKRWRNPGWCSSDRGTPASPGGLEVSPNREHDVMNGGDESLLTVTPRSKNAQGSSPTKSPSAAPLLGCGSPACTTQIASGTPPKRARTTPRTSPVKMEAEQKPPPSSMDLVSYLLEEIASLKNENRELNQKMLTITSNHQKEIFALMLKQRSESDTNRRKLSLADHHLDRLTEKVTDRHLGAKVLQNKVDVSGFIPEVERKKKTEFMKWMDNVLWRRIYRNANKEKRVVQPTFGLLLRCQPQDTSWTLIDTHRSGIASGSIIPDLAACKQDGTICQFQDIGFILELKSHPMNKKSALGQVARYCQTILKRSFLWRTEFIGIVTDFVTTLGVKTKYPPMSSRIEVEFTEFKSFPCALCSLLYSTTETTGWVAKVMVPKSIQNPKKFLGYGATGFVFRDKEKTWKFASKPEAKAEIQHEYKILERMNAKNVPNIPSVIEREEYGFAMSEQGYPVENTDSLCSLFEDYTKALVEASRCDIVHRDIRPQNLLVCNGGGLVIDWGFACTTKKMIHYEGTVRFASKRVWTLLTHAQSRGEQNPKVKCTLADDLESLVKSMAALSSKSLLECIMQDRTDTYLESHKCWDYLFSHYPQWNRLLGAAQRMDIKAMVTAFSLLFLDSPDWKDIASKGTSQLHDT
ncbi:hypothetical protein Pelo_8827 [Pelomyxa schiedti]|nr:hypothetical protein Pelo_8827 [Pelomyxa schiedti]